MSAYRPSVPVRQRVGHCSQCGMDWTRSAARGFEEVTCLCTYVSRMMAAGLDHADAQLLALSPPDSSWLTRAYPAREIRA